VSELSDSDGPLVIVDFDDVINVRTVSTRMMREMCLTLGWRYQAVTLDAGPEMIFYHPRAGTLLRELARYTGAELAWGTLRREWANNASPLLYLPPLPVAPVRLDEPKAVHVVPWTAGRPFAWFEDLDEECELADELAGDQPHKMIRVDPRTGLTLEDVRSAGQWLRDLAATRSGQDPAGTAPAGNRRE
jgi:hypothetical protein